MISVRSHARSGERKILAEIPLIFVNDWSIIPNESLVEKFCWNYFIFWNIGKISAFQKNFNLISKIFSFRKIQQKFREISVKISKKFQQNFTENSIQF